ncbi:hypothetical protein ONE63_011207 [Megalurothrips usitatus]|uniref:RNA-directed DNA polymerase n=1 Tax=Megalurothrips usitatus TaxID=439358 RepID=A0AAV7X420_9NEOP|nr:hypothetical protein ONE63_011207 [Megalurothrips usitatus]
MAALDMDELGEVEPVYDDARFKEEQRADLAWKDIVGRLEDGEDVANYFLHGGLLYRQDTGRGGLLVVPRAMTAKLIRDFHEPPWAAHASRERTLQKLRERFWWPGMYTQVLRHTRACHSCALHKRGTHGRVAPLQEPVVPRAPFEAVATDLYGPLPVSISSGAQYILVAVCLQTRWAEAVPLRDTKAATVARAIVQEVCCRYGTPQYLLSDNGPCYKALVYKEMCRILQVKAIKTTPLHPASNGIVERLNRVITEALAHYVDEKKHDWEEFLQLIMLNHRSSVCRSTQETPYFSVFHRDMSLPTEALLAPPRVSYADSPDVMERLLQDMQVSSAALRRQNQRAKREAKLQYDKRTGPVKFFVGERVYLAVRVPTKGLGRKWSKRYRGPFRIEQRHGDTTFTIRSLFDARPVRHTVHCNRLKHAYECDNLLTANRRSRRTRHAEDAGDDGTPWQDVPTSSGSETSPSDGEASPTPARPTRQAARATRSRAAARRGSPQQQAEPAARLEGGDDLVPIVQPLPPPPARRGPVLTPGGEGESPSASAAAQDAVPGAQVPEVLPTPQARGRALRRRPERASLAARRPARRVVIRRPVVVAGPRHCLRGRPGGYMLRRRK